MTKHQIVLAIHPSSRGLGYVISGGTPNDIIYSNVGTVKVLSPSGYVKRLKKIMRRYHPTVVVLKDYVDAGVAVSSRVRKIIESMEQEARSIDLKVYRYSRKQIRKVFEPYTDNTNKYGISLVLATWYPNLKQYLVPPRTYMDQESYRMAEFDAYALLYCYFTLSHLNLNKNNEHTNN